MARFWVNERDDGPWQFAVRRSMVVPSGAPKTGNYIFLFSFSYVVFLVKERGAHHTENETFFHGARAPPPLLIFSIVLGRSRDAKIFNII